jgi:hypothetical protein
MITTVPCPHCSAKLQVPDARLGVVIQCPLCHKPVRTARPASGDVEVIDDDPDIDDGGPRRSPRDALAERAADGTPPPPRKKKKKKKKGAEPDWKLIKWVAVGGAVAVGLLAWGLFLLLQGTPPPAIPGEKWVPLEVPGRFKVLLPGHAQMTTQNLPGVVMHSYSASPGPQAVFAVAYSEGPLPEARRALGVEGLLHDSCDGAMLKTPGAREESRTPVELNGIPGKQLVAKVPEGRGKLIMRNYYNPKSGRIFIVLVGGEKYDVGQDNVEKVFNSFQILDRDEEMKK